jgi:DnaK suppressor protein
MNVTQTDEVRQALLARREEVSGELDRMAEELASFGVEQDTERGGLGNHLAEDGSNVEAQERILAMSGDLSSIVSQVDEALVRLEEGSYGTCQRCGRPINPERLEAFPYVAHCIECQTIVERQSHGRLSSSPVR